MLATRPPWIYFRLGLYNTWSCISSLWNDDHLLLELRSAYILYQSTKPPYWKLCRIFWFRQCNNTVLFSVMSWWDLSKIISFNGHKYGNQYEKPARVDNLVGWFNIYIYIYIYIFTSEASTRTIDKLWDRYVGPIGWELM